MKEADTLMKAGKSDMSDAILNAPDLMYDQHASVYRSWLVHGTVIPSLMACAFLPLLKNALILATTEPF